MHLEYNQEDFCSDILKYGDLLGQVDISGPHRVVPDGMPFDYQRLIKALCEVGFDGYLLSEFRAEPQRNTAQIGLDYIKSLL